MLIQSFWIEAKFNSISSTKVGRDHLRGIKFPLKMSNNQVVIDIVHHYLKVVVNNAE